jgi:hypothetical protein
MTNQLQVVTEEVAQLRDTNAKLSHDLDGKSNGPLLSLFSLLLVSLSDPDSLVVVAGARVIRAGMVAKLAAVKQEQNAVVLKVIKKEGAIGRLSEQLQSGCRALVPSSSSSQARHDLTSLFVFQRFRPSWSNLEHPESKTQSP